MLYGLVTAIAALQLQARLEQSKIEAELQKRELDELERNMRQAGAIDVEARWVEETPALPPPRP